MYDGSAGTFFGIIGVQFEPSLPGHAFHDAIRGRANMKANFTRDPSNLRHCDMIPGTYFQSRQISQQRLEKNTSPSQVNVI